MRIDNLADIAGFGERVEPESLCPHIPAIVLPVRPHVAAIGLFINGGENDGTAQGIILIERRIVHEDATHARDGAQIILSSLVLVVTERIL